MPLAAAFFMSLLVLYFLVNWIPVLLNQAAFPPSIGILAISMFSLGGIVGALAQGPLMRRFGSVKSIVIELAIVGCLVLSLGKIPLTATVISALTFAIGWTLQGAQAGLNAFAAMHYQNSIRATAMGLTLGTGRLGSIAGGFLGGLALAAGCRARSWPPPPYPVSSAHWPLRAPRLGKDSSSVTTHHHWSSYDRFHERRSLGMVATARSCEVRRGHQ
jgi:MFS family permease